MLSISNLTQQKIDEGFFENIVQTFAKVMKIKEPVEISLVLVGPGRIKKLNYQYRKKNRVTDVLSFPYQLTKKEFVESPDKIKQLGEIVICLARVKKQAKRLERDFRKELALVFVHGLLHLLGYDHQSKEQAEKMKEMEERILKELK